MKKVILTIIEIILILVIIFAGYKIFEYFIDLNNSKSQFDDINDIVDEIREEKSSGKIVTESIEIVDEDDLKSTKEIIAELKKINKDIIGYIEVGGLPIKYPVVQASDNDYYLRRDLNRKYSIPGTIYMDYRNDSEMTDQNTVIYGHNMRNKTMFGTLDKLGNQEFVNSNGGNYIRYTTEDNIFIYKMISYMIVDEKDDYRTPNVDGESFINFLNKSKSNSIVDFGDFEFSEETKILTLSTCTDVETNRDAVQAVLVEKY